ncbi:unnamed protein product, partial [Callosobruchus maculatus]
ASADALQFHSALAPPARQSSAERRTSHSHLRPVNDLLSSRHRRRCTSGAFMEPLGRGYGSVTIKIFQKLAS